MSEPREEVLRLVNVWKAFGDTEVLRGVDLTVASHQVVALIGASGSGKSTLLRTINLLERVDDGQVYLRGVDISRPHHLGFVGGDRRRAHKTRGNHHYSQGRGFACPDQQGRAA